MRKCQVVVVALGLILLLAGFGLAQRGPRIYKIPQGALDSLQAARTSVNEVGGGMSGRIMRLQELLKKYSKTCGEGHNDDKGCIELRRQMKKEHLEFLDELREEFPKMRDSIEATAKTMGVSLQRYARTKSVKQLYEDVRSKRTMRTPKGPLSKKLGSWAKSLQQMTGSTDYSPFESTLSVQADLIASLEIIDYLEAEITRQRTFFLLSPEDDPSIGGAMATVMRGMADVFDYEFDVDLSAYNQEWAPPDDGGQDGGDDGVSW